MIVPEHRNTNTAKLPYMAANIPCLYLYDDEKGRPPMPQARRVTDPMPGNPDNSEYDTLQPGLRVTSAYPPNKPDTFLSMTSGVLVRDRVGKRMHDGRRPMDSRANAALESSTHCLWVAGETVMEYRIWTWHSSSQQTQKNSPNATFQSNYMPKPVQFERLISAMDL
jgi:hypothetical protein